MRGLLRYAAASVLAAPALAGPVLYGRSSGNNLDRCDHDNPFKGVQVYANYFYANEVQTTINAFAAKNDTAGVAAAKILQQVPTFMWLSTIYDISGLEPQLLNARAIMDATQVQQTIPLVIYNLPNRDCAAFSSAGELDIEDDGLNRYKTEYIDQIVSIIRKYPSLRYVLVIEPDSLANLVTNLSIDKCAQAAATYKAGIAYAITQFQDKNVAAYLDIGHSNWLGWESNLAPTAQLLAEVKQWAGARNNKWRGFVSDVSNYNVYNDTVADTIYGPGPDNPNWNEWRFFRALTPYLVNLGLPSKFIVDQSRSGVIDIRKGSGSWCNVNGAGLGMRPTTNTGDCNVDAIVWVKPPGESDGSSDPNASRFDPNCDNEDAYVPSPQAGSWNEPYVEMLIKNANPPLV